MVDEVKGWTFPIQWSRNYGEEIAFRTEVITSRNGSEQRIAQRVNPRLTFDFDSFLNFQDFQKAVTLLAENQAREMAVPHPYRTARVTSSATPDTTTTRAVSICIDDSGSMSDNGKLNTMKTAMSGVFDEIEAALEDGRLSRLDIHVCAWGDSSISQTYSNATVADIQALRTFVDGFNAGLGGTDFDQAAQEALTFFDDTLGSFLARRTWFFVTDGQPTGGSLSAAQATAADLIDQDTGDFSVSNATKVDVYGVNIQDTTTSATEQIDNTPGDGVPVVSADDPDALLHVLLSGVFGQNLGVDSIHPWMVNGTPFFIEQRDQPTQIARLVRAGGDQMFTDGPLKYAVSPDAKVYGAVFGYFDGETSLRAATSRVGLSRVSFKAHPVGTYHDAWDAPPPDTLNGLELLRTQHQWAGDLRVKFEQPFEGLDLNRGATDRLYPVAHTTRITRLRNVIRNDDHMNRIIGLFYRCRGRQKPFYCPTFIDEFRPKFPLSSVQQTMIVEGRLFYDQFNESQTHRFFQIVTPLGTFVREIESMAVDGQGDTQLNLDQVWSTDLSLESIMSCSWVVKHRFETDTLSLEWLTDRVAEATITIRTLEDTS